MKAISIRRFSTLDSSEWNDFVKLAKNATFLFDRNYMDYHSDRFVDHSVMVFERGMLRAVLPAHEEGEKIISHGGLTYGGLLLSLETQMDEALCWFYHTLKYYHTAGFKSMLYKCIPQHYCTYPSYEDQYAMFRLEANLIRREMTCVYARLKALQVKRRRKVNSAQKACRIFKAQDPTAFWNKVLVPNLQDRFNANPTHSESEIKFLMDRFPNRIHLYEVHRKEIIGGAVLFETENTAHLQYSSATTLGKEIGALDYLLHHLLTEVFAQKEFFSFGTSNEPGNQINKGLIDWKESFGARCHARDIYEIKTANFEKLNAYA
ncbi:MAG TPA: hypothetical protein VL728_02650 [Cyclobacteriaceae bacterium]|nr:hypothetical protein [Cyclobacteriaceae bacterium]